MTTPCAHDETTLECPFCRGAVDEDTRVCAVCRAAVAPLTICVACGEAVTISAEEVLDV